MKLHFHVTIICALAAVGCLSDGKNATIEIIGKGFTWSEGRIWPAWPGERPFEGDGF